jgi:hypothetical protein
MGSSVLKVYTVLYGRGNGSFEQDLDDNIPRPSPGDGKPSHLIKRG